VQRPIAQPSRHGSEMNVQPDSPSSVRPRIFDGLDRSAQDRTSEGLRPRPQSQNCRKDLARYNGATTRLLSMRPDLIHRQLECLAWVAEGKSAIEIGMILGISSGRVDRHIVRAATYSASRLTRSRPLPDRSRLWRLPRRSSAEPERVTSASSAPFRRS
jgi:DNA-binding CsgD family transcriptional regulator